MSTWVTSIECHDFECAPMRQQKANVIDGSLLAADSFLMKGEEVPAHARWGGNTAREM
jgi:hypothetical protein